ncbi:serine/threonine protein phosphatase PP2A-1 catalytic subunit [Clavispora lusitaniae ATCC 42720]|uniref:Serine/threonine protein phosphatase PP2A-1 catalytic subunit n=1 Tax=Clavispora lusitaniae (strain ATCC 42720) TaxID=306902 RepID=C4Y1A9_CLAL4|nr:serine/threonine protein phosphatase PP2A-1 catalytic subunit [Clavispora lusitaniae ATCC 42720]EEQ37868.1 serine/threonine protein phosphatase PP2A-1 catalytic subunit [Clavispora lusitaniae ATCC 42720]
MPHSSVLSVEICCQHNRSTVLSCYSGFTASLITIHRSQEVVGGLARDRGLAWAHGWIVSQKSSLVVLVHLHDGGSVAAAVAVVGRTEDGHHALSVRPQVALHDKSMRTGNETQVVGVVESLGDISPESEACTAGRNAPAATIVGIRPQQVAHGALVRHLSDPVQLAHSVDGLDHGRQAAMQTKHLIIHQRRDGEVVKQVCEELPHRGQAVLAQALVVEPVHLCDSPQLVVAPQDRDSVWEPHLHTHQVRHCFHRVVSAVHVVAHEQVVGVGTRSTNLEKLHQVVESAVHIAANGHWHVHRSHILFELQHVHRHVTQLFNVGLR